MNAPFQRAMKMSSFTRAFSTRNKKLDVEPTSPTFVGRAASQRGGRAIARTQISSPIALVSTSNMHLDDAHDIAGTSPVHNIRDFSSPSSTSSSSEEDSDASLHSNSHDTTDASSVEDMPTGTEPEPNHLSCYFKPSLGTSTRPGSASPSVSESESTPRIPQRSRSHSKKAHESIHRKNSIKRMLSPPPAREIRSSTDMFSAIAAPVTSVVEVPRDHPFGNELAQLDEVAEEFGQVVTRSPEDEADALYMATHNLAHFSAAEYMSELQILVHDLFADKHASPRRARDIGNFF